MQCARLGRERAQEQLDRLVPGKTGEQVKRYWDVFFEKGPSRLTGWT
jgi:hypothetical protein